MREYVEWVRSSMATSSVVEKMMNPKKFGLRMSKLIGQGPDVEPGTFAGITKSRRGAGVLYTFDVPLVVREMVVNRWAAQGEIERVEQVL